MKYIEIEVIDSIQRIDNAIGHAMNKNTLNTNTVNVLRKDLAIVIAYFDTKFKIIEEILSKECIEKN